MVGIEKIPTFFAFLGDLSLWFDNYFILLPCPFEDSVWNWMMDIHID